MEDEGIAKRVACRCSALLQSYKNTMGNLSKTYRNKRQRTRPYIQDRTNNS